MLLAPFFVSLVGLGVKGISRIPAVEILFLEAAVTLIASYTTLCYYKIPVKGKNRKLLLMRAVAGTVSTALFFITLQNIPLSSAITLHYTSPIFATVLGIAIVKEHVSPWQWVFIFISFLGVVCMNGFDLGASFLYNLLGLASALVRGAAHNIVRKMHTNEHPVVVVFYASFISVLVTSGYLLYDFVPPQPREWLPIGLVGLLAYMAHYCTVRAYQLAPIAQVSTVSYTAVIYALLFSYLFLDETFPWVKLLGMGLVLVGILLNLFYKMRETT